MYQLQCIIGVYVWKVNIIFIYLINVFDEYNL